MNAFSHRIRKNSRKGDYFFLPFLKFWIARIRDVTMVTMMPAIKMP